MPVLDLINNGLILSKTGYILTLFNFHLRKLPLYVACHLLYSKYISKKYYRNKTINGHSDKRCLRVFHIVFWRAEDEHYTVYMMTKIVKTYEANGLKKLFKPEYSMYFVTGGKTTDWQTKSHTITKFEEQKYLGRKTS